MEPSQPHCVACIPPHKDSPDLVHGPIPAYILPHKDSLDLVHLVHLIHGLIPSCNNCVIVV